MARKTKTRNSTAIRVSNDLRVLDTFNVLLNEWYKSR